MTFEYKNHVSSSISTLGAIYIGEGQILFKARINGVSYYSFWQDGYSKWVTPAKDAFEAFKNFVDKKNLVLMTSLEINKGDFVSGSWHTDEYFKFRSQKP